MNRLSIRIIHTGMIDQRCALASESAPAGFPKAAVSAWEANDGFVPQSCSLNALQLMTAEVGNLTWQVSHRGPLLGPLGQYLP